MAEGTEILLRETDSSEDEEGGCIDHACSKQEMKSGGMR